MGASQIMMGLDDPYPLGEMEGVGTSYPGRVLDYAIETGVLSGTGGKRYLAQKRIGLVGHEKV